MASDDRPAADFPKALNVQGRALYKALCARLAAQDNLPDDTVFTEVSGAHYVTVTREEGNLLLWLLARRGEGSGVVQSEINPARPLALVDPYLQAAMLALLWSEAPGRVFTTGLGGGCLPTLLHCYFPAAQIDCVELDPMVASAAQSCFGFQRDTTLRLEIDDGRNWLARQPSDDNYDIIFIDAFLDNGYAPVGMATREFCELCKLRLALHGVLVVNLLYLGTHQAARVRTVMSVFDHVYLCSLGEENDLLFAGQTPLPPYDEMVRKAELLKQRCQFEFPYVRHALRLLPAEITLSNLADATVLHDGRPPADYFSTLPALDDEMDIAPDIPCLCGSGELFSRCHGRAVTSAK